MEKLVAKIAKIKHRPVKSLLNKALEMGIKIGLSHLDNGLVVLSRDGKKIIFKSTVIPLPRRMGNLTTDKLHTKVCLGAFGISTPRGFAAETQGEAAVLLKKEKLRFPLILKPLNGAFAKQVVWDIKTKKELFAAILAFKKSEKKHRFKKFLVEEMASGDEYRILMIKGKVVSCVKKIPASLVGDGKSTIKKLIEAFNKTRVAGFDLKIDSVASARLKETGLTLQSVLPAGYVLKLRNNVNMSDGGRSIDCTSQLSRDLQQACSRAVEAIGLSYGGIDLISQNIRQKNPSYVILEINPDPVYIMHEKPLVEGRGVDVSKIILKLLFPGLK